ncbi:MAG: hypothetical protein WBP45_00050 [Daejeonella sp.]
MEVLLLIPLVIFLLFFPQLIAGQLARSMGRNFWFWFWISFVLPVISIIILLNLKDKNHESGIELADHVKKNN